MVSEYISINKILMTLHLSLCIYLSTYSSKPWYSLKGQRRKHSANEVQFQQVMNGRKRTCWVFIVNVLAVSSLTTLESTWELSSSLNSKVRSGKKEITTTITQHTCTHIEKWHFGVWCILNVWHWHKKFIHKLFILCLCNISWFCCESIWFRELNLTKLDSAKQLTWVVLIQIRLLYTDVVWMHGLQFNDIYVFNKSRIHTRSSGYILASCNH